MTDQLLKKELRCGRCSRLLMKGEVTAIEIKCPKCGYIQVFHNGLKNKTTKNRKPLISILSSDKPV